MKKIGLFLALVILNIACSNNNNETNNNTDQTVVEQTNTTPTLATEASPEELKRIALSFHQWYISNQDKMVNDAPITELRLKQSADKKCEFDFDNYFGELKKLGTISERFLKKEKERVAACGQAMKKVAWEDYSEAVIFAYPESCDFLNYRYWIQSQESFSGVEVLTLNPKDNFWIAELQFFVEENGNKTFSKQHIPVVKIEKEGNQYMITEINWQE